MLIWACPKTHNEHEQDLSAGSKHTLEIGASPTVPAETGDGKRVEDAGAESNEGGRGCREGRKEQKEQKKQWKTSDCEALDDSCKWDEEATPAGWALAY